MGVYSSMAARVYNNDSIVSGSSNAYDFIDKLNEENFRLFEATMECDFLKTLSEAGLITENYDDGVDELPKKTLGMKIKDSFTKCINWIKEQFVKFRDFIIKIANDASTKSIKKYSDSLNVTNISKSEMKIKMYDIDRDDSALGGMDAPELIATELAKFNLYSINTDAVNSRTITRLEEIAKKYSDKEPTEYEVKKLTTPQLDLFKKNINAGWLPLLKAKENVTNNYVKTLKDKQKELAKSGDDEQAQRSIVVGKIVKIVTKVINKMYTRAKADLKAQRSVAIEAYRLEKKNKKTTTSESYIIQQLSDNYVEECFESTFYND